ncbi:hypothetical protein HZB96_00085 [Candidatus Gottesmanbacteria bacterium]|nr:hypothetical protein [Candidatus Gottesmanbacteria bacterium]MBI5452636.1 hypothetical protein [Candidatus Gottesmanbacteria bacterium]
MREIPPRASLGRDDNDEYSNRLLDPKPQSTDIDADDLEQVLEGMTRESAEPGVLYRPPSDYTQPPPSSESFEE